MAESMAEGTDGPPTAVVASRRPWSHRDGFFARSSGVSRTTFRFL